MKGMEPMRFSYQTSQFILAACGGFFWARIGEMLDDGRMEMAALYGVATAVYSAAYFLLGPDAPEEDR